ncbi:MAG: ABC transporter permease [Acidimicrobiia bacterium]
MTDTLIAPAIEPLPVEPPATPKQRRSLPKPTLVLAVIWLVGLTFVSVFADFLPFVRGYAQRVRGATRFAFGPGNDFWFGSDQLGRDVFARCVYGARISLLVATASILTGIIIGGTLGLIAGYRRGAIDRVISIFTDSLLALPALIIAILFVGRFDALRLNNPDTFGWLSRTWSIVFVLSLLSIAPLARIVRAQTLSLSQREFVLAARSLGAKNTRVILREILPNLVPAMVSVAFTGIAILLVAEGGLAFLGYSVQAPTPTWGYLINEGRPRIEQAWWATLMPCFMMFITVLAFNLIGDRVARHFDIREATL